jgi:hypothetical protein
MHIVYRYYDILQDKIKLSLALRVGLKSLQFYNSIKGYKLPGNMWNWFYLVDTYIKFLFRTLSALQYGHHLSLEQLRWKALLTLRTSLRSCMADQFFADHERQTSPIIYFLCPNTATILMASFKMRLKISFHMLLLFCFEEPANTQYFFLWSRHYIPVTWNSR